MKWPGKEWRPAGPLRQDGSAGQAISGPLAKLRLKPTRECQRLAIAVVPTAG
jgi:hypothetical protein